MADDRKFTHIDCFAGPGGICTGLAAAGFHTLVAIEYIKTCCENYRYSAELVIVDPIQIAVGRYVDAVS